MATMDQLMRQVFGGMQSGGGMPPQVNWDLNLPALAPNPLLFPQPEAAAGPTIMMPPEPAARMPKMPRAPRMAPIAPPLSTGPMASFMGRWGGGGGPTQPMMAGRGAGPLNHQFSQAFGQPGPGQPRTGVRPTAPGARPTSGLGGAAAQRQAAMQQRMPRTTQRLDYLRNMRAQRGV